MLKFWEEGEKKKENDGNRSMKPENRLEALLIQAGTGMEGSRKDFYSEFLQSEILVLTGEPLKNIGEVTLKEDETIEFVMLENGSLPIFSSVSRIRDGNPQEEISYIKLSVQDFLEIYDGRMKVILNPFSPYGKEFTPEELRMIRKHKFDELVDGQKNVQDIEIQEETEMLIGLPEEEPIQLLRSLEAHFVDDPDLKAAYYAQVMMVGVDKEPNLLIVLDMETENQDLVQEAGKIASEHLSDEEVIDFMTVVKSDPDRNIINDMKKFY